MQDRLPVRRSVRTLRGARSAAGSRRRSHVRARSAGSRSRAPRRRSRSRRVLGRRLPRVRVSPAGRRSSPSTDLDPDANRQRMEALVHARRSSSPRRSAGPLAASDKALSPTTRLAAMLKEALASNTIGGKVDRREPPARRAGRRAAGAGSWSRIGPVPETAPPRAGRSLSAGVASDRRNRPVAVSGRPRRERPERREGLEGRESTNYTVALPAPSVDLDQLHIEDQRAVRSGSALCRRAPRESRIASSRLRPSAATPSVQPSNHPVEREVDRRAAQDRAVEQLAVGRPARIVHRDFAGRLRVSGADAGRQDFVGQAARRLLGIGGRRLDIGAAPGRRVR